MISSNLSSNTDQILEDEAKAAIERVLSSDETDFVTVCRLGGLDVGSDLEYRNLSFADFGAADLRGVSLRGANLSGSYLDLCCIDESTCFESAITIDTIFPPATNFDPDDNRRYQVVLFGLSLHFQRCAIRSMRAMNDRLSVIACSTGNGVPRNWNESRWLYLISDAKHRDEILSASKEMTRASLITLDSANFTVSVFNFWTHGYTNPITIKCHSVERAFEYIEFYVGNSIV